MRTKRVPSVVSTCIDRLLIAAVFLLAGLPAVAGEIGQERGFTPNQVYQIGEIDSVNVSNGDVIVRIPIGHEYSVGPTLRYQFTLTYNSKVWEYGFGALPGAPMEDQRYAYPEKRSNAGLGWIFSLGRLAIDIDHNLGEPTGWTYVAPDGAEFKFSFSNSLNDDPDQTVLYAFSGRYLRLRILPSTYEIDFPDGEIHTFDSDGNLVQMRDPFGNWVKIDIQNNQWTVTDGFGTKTARTHYIDLQDVSALYPFPAYSENFGMRVVAADLEAFDGARAEYAFTYKDNASIGYGVVGTGNPPPCVKGPLLTTVLLPDGSNYGAAYNEIPAEHCGAYVLNDGSGTIRSLDLPTGGSIEWTHGGYDMPLKDCYSPVIGYSNGVDGVTSRTFKDRDENIISQWKYTQRLLLPYLPVSGKICGSDTVVQVPNSPREQYINIVEGPDGLVTKHYFSAWSENTLHGDPSPNGFVGDEMGLPISRGRERDGHFLSTEVFDCSNGCPRDQFGVVDLSGRQPVRRTYLRYKRQQLFHDGAPWPLLIDESRPYMVEGQLTETEIGESGIGARFTKTTSSGFDGYGHFATTVTDSNFPGVQSRSSTVERQHNVSIGAWILDMYGDSVVQEGALTTKTKTEFDWLTGFRKSVRTHADSGQEQGKDLLTVWCRDALTVAGARGFVTSERYVGGDGIGIPSGDLCTASTRAEGHYFLSHTYLFDEAKLTGHKTQWDGTSFFSADEDYDPSSGLVETTRDSAGVPTIFKYDVLGRLKEVRPDQQAWTRYRYDRTSSPVSVHVDVWPNGSTAPAASSDGALNDQHYFYDDLGRLILTKSRMPGADAWAAVRTTYDASGRVATASVPVETDDAGYEAVAPSHKTTSTYDILGRTTKVVAPDGSEVLFDYTGDREKTRTQNIWNGQSEIPAPTTEEYDGFGRLVSVTERSNADGTDVTTEYAYATGDRLTSVTINGIQPRTFEYDGRGFLLRETHPESGLTSYTYDARGNTISKTAADSRFDLQFTYDPAGRLKTVGGGDGPLKEFEYANDNGADDWRKGKLVKATRYNYPATSPSLNTRQDTIRVIESYAYRRQNGRQTDRRTEIWSGIGPAATQLTAFDQSEHYNELDLPDVVTYPKCDLCGLPPRDSVTTHYQYGRVQSVDEAIESMTYAPTGAWIERKHANQIADVQTPDPHGMARPRSIGVSLPASCTAIASQPEDVLIAAGGSATLTVTAVSSGATYQWYRGPRGDTRAILNDEVANVLNLSGVTATTSYWCRVIVNGCSEDSRTATVDTCRLIATEPESVRVEHGASTTLSLTAHHADATFQWYKGLRGDISTPVEGATFSSLSLTGMTVTESYWCRVRRVDPNDPSNVCTQDSQTATVTVCEPFEILGGGTSGLSTVVIDVPLTFSVSTSGEHLTYSWYKRRASDPISARVPIGSGKQIVFTPTAETTVEDPLVISVEVTNGCASEEHTIAQLHVVTLPPCQVHMELAPFELDSVIPGQAAILTARMKVAPATGIELYTDIKYRFRWYQFDSLQQDHLAEGELPEGATAQHEETATSGYHLRSFENQSFVRLDATVLCSTGSTTVTSPVSSHRSFVFYYGHCPVPDVVSDPPEAILRDVTGVQLTADSIYPWATFQWYEGESGNTANEAWQGDAQTITVTQPGTYWVRASSDCAHADSPTVVVSEEIDESICTPVRIVRDPEDQTIAAFQPVTLSVDATATPQPNHFVWRTVPGPNVASGAASVTIDPGPRLTTDYSVKVSNDCSHADSRSARVHVMSCADMTIHVQPVDLSIAEGDTASLTITATSVAPLRYQWYSGESGDTSSPIGGVSPTDANYDPSKHGPTLDLGTPTASQRYWVRLSFDDKTKCEVDSRTATVTVCAAPRITGPPHDRTSVVPGVDQIFEVRAEGEGLSYAWYEGPENDETKRLSTATSLILYPRVTTDYWVKVTSDCAPPYADRTAKAAFKVSVCPMFPGDGMPTATNTLVTSGTTTTLSVDVDRGDIIQWYKVVGAGDPEKFAEGPELTTVTTPAITEQTEFFARATSGACSRDSERIVIEICTDPTIHWIANSPTQVAKGETFFLSVGLGVGQTANIQWYRGTVSGDVANSTPICGLTNACQINSLQATTSYWVRAVDETTACYADTSVRTVNVCIPTIMNQPQSVTINSGASTTLTVTTDDLPGVSYQWYIGQPGDTSNLLSGQTSNALTVTPSATTTYWVRVTGCPSPLNPVSRDSQAATVTICQPPAITSNLQARVVPRNYNLTLSIAATGDGLHYQWYEGAAGVVTKPIGTDSSSYTFTTTVSTRYWVRITGNCGSVDSAAPAISVEPGITTHPAGGLVVSGATRTLTVVASGADLTYSWYQDNGSTSTLIAGATASSYVTPPITADVTYYARVCSGPACIDSNDAVFQVCTDPRIHWSSGNPKQVEKGATFFLGVGLSVGQTANMQWYRGTVSGDVANSTAMCGTTNACQINSLQATTSYWVRAVSPTTTCYDDTAVHTVNVCIPTIAAQPQSVTINAGASTTLTVTTDNLPGVTYQWYTGQPGVTTNPLAGKTSNTLTVTPSATTTYWVRVTGCPSPLNPVTRDSAAATVTICQAPQISQQPQSQGGSGSRTFSVTANGTELTYQWYEGASGGVSKPIAGATSASVTVNPLYTTKYWVRVNGRCGSVNSASATLARLPVIQTEPDNSKSVTKGTSTQLSVVVLGNELTYQWYEKTASGSVAIAGQTTATLTTPAINADTTFFCRVWSGSATTAILSKDSADATVKICLPNTFTTTMYGSESQSRVMLSIDTPLSGETFQWYSGVSGNLSSSTPVGTGTVVNVYPAETTAYWVRTTRAGCHADSPAKTVHVCRPKITSAPASVTIPRGSSTILSVSATGTGTLYYQWYKNNDNVLGANAATYDTGPLDATATYWVRVTASSSCATRWTDSSVATVTVCQPPVIVEQPGPEKLWPYNHPGLVLSVSATGDDLHYQWYEGAVGDTSKPVGTDSSQYPLQPTATKVYWVRITGSCGPPISSQAVRVSVYPKINVQPADTDVCGVGGTATFSVTAANPGDVATYQWYRKVSGQATELVGGNSSTLQIAVTQVPVEFWVTLTSGLAKTTSTKASVATMNPVPTVTSFTAPPYGSYRYQLTVVVPSSQASLVKYRFYQGALGDTTTLLGDQSLHTKVVTPPYRPITYWVRVYYPDTGCATDRAVTIP